MNESAVYATPAKSTEGKYLFCYFTGNEPERERNEQYRYQSLQAFTVWKRWYIKVKK